MNNATVAGDSNGLAENLGVLELGWSWVQFHPWTTLLALLITNLTWTRYRTGLRHIPGPFVASFSSFWKLRATWNQNMHRENVRVHEDYGPIVRIGPNHVSVSDPESMQTIYGIKNVYRKVTKLNHSYSSY